MAPKFISCTFSFSSLFMTGHPGTSRVYIYFRVLSCITTNFGGRLYLQFYEGEGSVENEVVNMHMVILFLCRVGTIAAVLFSKRIVATCNLENSHF